MYPDKLSIALIIFSLIFISIASPLSSSYSRAMLTDYQAQEPSPVQPPLPFSVGETLKYELKFSRLKIINVTVGEITITVSETPPDDLVNILPAVVGQAQEQKQARMPALPEANTLPAVEAQEQRQARMPALPEANTLPAVEAQEQRQARMPALPEANTLPAVSSQVQANGAIKVDTLYLRAEAVSKGFLTALFGIKVHDIFDSVVNSKDLGSYAMIKRLEEGKRKREQIAIFNRASKKVKFIDKDLNNPQAEPRVVEAEIPDWVTDIISSVYYVRAQKLSPSKKIEFPLSDDGKVMNMEVTVLKAEDVNVEAGKFKALKVEAKAFGGNLFKGKGRMFVWLTSDARQIPVRFQIKGSFGTVNGALIEMRSGKTQ